LSLQQEDAELFGEAVERRLRHLAQAMGVKYQLTA
jgi:exopolyphosphatase/guanosine-5'-triphosphate,3'-diphosphate pyrophosphatase